MQSNFRTAELIHQLKEIKNEQGLSVQAIYNMLDEANCHVSINTLKKVFAEGSEDENFNFHGTIQPISRVLLGIYGKDKGNAEVDGLRAAVRVKDEQIEKLEQEIVALKTENSRKNVFLMHQIELKDERIDRLLSSIDAMTKQINTLLEQRST